MANIPQNVAYVQTEQELVSYINNLLQSQTLPAYQLESLLNNIVRDLHEVAEKEYQMSLKAYQEEQQKEQEVDETIELTEETTESEN